MSTLSPATAAALVRLHAKMAAKIRNEIEQIVPVLDALNDLVSQLSVQAPEFRPSTAQRKILELMRGGRRMKRKQLFGTQGIGRRAYSGRGSLDEMMEFGLVDVEGEWFFLTEPGEAMSEEWAEE